MVKPKKGAATLENILAFHFYKQLNAMDCGSTCLRMVAKYYGKHYKTDDIRRVAGYEKRALMLLRKKKL